MQRIVPSLWFDHNAAEATEFYASVFPDAKVLSTQHYPSEGLPEWQASYAGLPLVVDFEINGFRMTAINAGREYRPNASISFMVNFDAAQDPEARTHLDDLWAALSDGGVIRMPLQEYPFSPHYGWVEDRYGVNWQLMISRPGADQVPPIVPCLTFGLTGQGDAMTAIEYYAEVFTPTYGNTVAYPSSAGPLAGKTMFADIGLDGVWFAAMDAADFDAPFTCGVSLMVSCPDQQEIDRLWSRLSFVPEAEQCGWCADQFGVSWQIIPQDLETLMSKPGATEKLYSMKKIDIAAFG